MNPNAPAIFARAEAIWAARYPKRNPNTYTAIMATSRLFGEATRQLKAEGLLLPYPTNTTR